MFKIEAAIKNKSDIRSSVAVIMSIYAGDNVSQFVSAINSVINQVDLETTYIRIYLGVDGPISGELHKALYSYSDHIYKLLAFENNRGLSYVLNDLINALEDESLVFRMDADDICYPTRFSKQLLYMSDNPDIDIVGAYITEMPPSAPQRTVFFPICHDEAIAQIHKRSPVAHPTVCFRRNVFQVIKSGYPHTRLSEDVALWFACIKAGLRFGNISEPLLFFRINDNFWHRRGILRAKTEYILWTKGVWGIYGLNWRLVFPLVRFLYRLSPKRIQKWGYASNFRSFNNTKLIDVEV